MNLVETLVASLILVISSNCSLQLWASTLATVRELLR